MNVIWSRRFVAGLRHEYAYLRPLNPAAAQDVRGRIIAAAESLSQFPHRGRAWRLRTARELLVPGLPYVIIYRLTGDGIVVLSLFHTSRDWPFRGN